MAEGINNSDFKKYKFRELKVYSSTEWLADNKKNTVRFLTGTKLPISMPNCHLSTSFLT